MTRPPRNSSPPLLRLAERLLRRGTAPDEMEFVLGDLDEEYRRLAGTQGQLRAALWFWAQVLSDTARRNSSYLEIPDREKASMFGSVSRDLRGAIRSVRQRPAFSAVVALTLAVGIGATAAIFSVVNAVSLRALPYPQADRLTVIREALANGNPVPTSYLTYRDWRQAGAFDDMAILSPFNAMILTGPEETLRLRAAVVSSSYFNLLGMRPAAGRFFGREADDPEGIADVAVISHGLWQRRFGGRADTIGQRVHLSGADYTVIGVADEEFVDLYSGGTATDAWVPITAQKQLGSATALERRAVRPFQVIARLASGVSLEEAQQELNGIAAGIAEASPEIMGTQGALAVSLRQQLVGGLNAPLITLLAGSGFLLLMGCINVASLMLFRSISRAREIAIRQAMGSSRVQLVRLLVAEALVLSAIGGALGVALARFGVNSMLSLNAVPLPPFMNVELDVVVLGATAALIGAVGLTVGLVPALRSTARDIGSVLTESDLRSAGRSNRRVSNVLIVAEVTVAVVLTVGSGLMLRSFRHLSMVDLGFRTEDVMSVQLNLPRTDYSTEEMVFGFRQRLQQNLARLPGAEFAVTVGPGLPGQASSYTTAVPDGKTVASQLEADLTRLHGVQPGALAALEIPVLAGRALQATDRRGTQRVAVISASMAETLWPGEDPIGRRFNHVIPPDRDPADFPPYEVVGVAADASLGGRLIGNFGVPVLNDMYVPYDQLSLRNNVSSFVVLVGTAGDPLAVTEWVRDVVREIDPNVPIFNPQDLATAATAELTVARFVAVLMGIFGSMSLLLAAIGIYGVLSQSVAARTREIGVRKALGAKSGATAWLVVGHAMRVAGVGVVVGLGLSYLLAQSVGSLLFGVVPSDPVTLVGTAIILSAVALLASYVPARRALRVDPVDSLRAD